MASEGDDEEVADSVAPRVSDRSLANLMPPWPKGVSGNPGGMTRGKRLLMQACQDFTEQNWQKIQELALKSPPLLVEIIRQGFGAPAESGQVESRMREIFAGLREKLDEKTYLVVLESISGGDKR